MNNLAYHSLFNSLQTDALFHCDFCWRLVKSAEWLVGITVMQLNRAKQYVTLFRKNIVLGTVVT